MSTNSDKANLDIYSRRDIVDTYAGANYITKCEEVIFDEYVGLGKAVLDLGVGGGRTASFLAPKAKEYIGSDYSIALVEASRRNYPNLRFELVDATNLSQFSDASFDVVIFSFNGLGEISSHAMRLACHREVCRVLKPGGFWIFSLHHAGSLFFRPQMAWRHAIGTLCRSVPRFFERIRTRAFWNGMDYKQTNIHGGLRILLARRSRVIAEVKEIGFSVERILGDDYPRMNISIMTRWYYYVCRKN